MPQCLICLLSMMQLLDWIRSYLLRPIVLTLELACSWQCKRREACISNALPNPQIDDHRLSLLSFSLRALPNDPLNPRRRGPSRSSSALALASRLRSQNIPLFRRNPSYHDNLKRRSILVVMSVLPRRGLAAQNVRIFRLHRVEYSGNAPADNGQSLTTMSK